MRKAEIITGIICIIIGAIITIASFHPALWYYRIIGPIIGAIFIVIGIAFGIYGLIRKS